MFGVFFNQSQAHGKSFAFVWPKPWRRSVSLLVAFSFIFPGISWAFLPDNFQIGSVLVHNRPLEISPAWGKIAQVSEAGPRVVVHIQDLHCNEEVQANIAHILQELTVQQGVSLIGLEGASFPVNTTKLGSFPVAEIRDTVARYLVRQGMIGGPEYFSIMGKTPVKLQGVENPGWYHAGLETVGKFLNSETQGICFDLQDALEQVKPHLYTPALTALDAKRQQFRSGKMPLEKYARGLVQAADSHGVQLNCFPTLTQFRRAQAGVFSTEVDAEALNRELGEADGLIRQKLYTAPAQEELDRWCRRAEVLEKLLNVSAAPQDLVAFRQERAAYAGSEFAAYLQKHNPSAGQALVEDSALLDRGVLEAERFYTLADLRSAGLAENLLKCMDAQRVNTAVLVTGGFHTAGIAQTLKKQGVTFISIVPRQSRADLVNPYFQLLKNQQTPLEQLLEKNQNLIMLPIKSAEVKPGTDPSQLVDEENLAQLAADANPANLRRVRAYFNTIQVLVNGSLAAWVARRKSAESFLASYQLIKQQWAGNFAGLDFSWPKEIGSLLAKLKLGAPAVLPLRGLKLAVMLASARLLRQASTPGSQAILNEETGLVVLPTALAEAAAEKIGEQGRPNLLFASSEFSSANSLLYLLSGKKMAGLIWALAVEAPLLAWAATVLHAAAFGKVVLVSLGAFSLPAAPVLMLAALAVFAGLHLVLQGRKQRAAGQALTWRAGLRGLGGRLLALSPYALVTSLISPWFGLAWLAHGIFDVSQIWPEFFPTKQDWGDLQEGEKANNRAWKQWQDPQARAVLHRFRERLDGARDDGAVEQALRQFERDCHDSGWALWPWREILNQVYLAPKGYCVTHRYIRLTKHSDPFFNLLKIRSRDTVATDEGPVERVYVEPIHFMQEAEALPRGWTVTFPRNPVYVLYQQLQAGEARKLELPVGLAAGEEQQMQKFSELHRTFFQQSMNSLPATERDAEIRRNVADHETEHQRLARKLEISFAIKNYLMLGERGKLDEEMAFIKPDTGGHAYFVFSELVYYAAFLNRPFAWSLLGRLTRQPPGNKGAILNKLTEMKSLPESELVKLSGQVYAELETQWWRLNWYLVLFSRLDTVVRWFYHLQPNLQQLEQGTGDLAGVSSEEVQLYLKRFDDLLISWAQTAPLQPLAGARELLSSLAASDLNLAVASGGQNIRIQEGLDRLQLNFFKGHIYGAPRRKSQTLEQVRRQVGQAGKVVMFGDTPYDMREARRVPGVTAVRILKTNPASFWERTRLALLQVLSWLGLCRLFGADYYISDYAQVRWDARTRTLNLGRFNKIFQVRGAVFDFDGTLIEDTHLGNRAYRQVAAEMSGLPLDSLRLLELEKEIQPILQNYSGRPAIDYIERFLQFREQVRSREEKRASTPAISELERQLKPQNLHTRLQQALAEAQQAPVFAPAVQVISPSSLKGYVDQFQKGADSIAALARVSTLAAKPGEDAAMAGQRLAAQKTSADVTLLHWQGSDIETPMIAMPTPGKLMVLVHRPEEMLLRYGEEKVKSVLTQAGAVVLMGKAWLPSYRKLLPGKLVVAIPHGFFSPGEPVDEKRLAPDAVNVVGAITAWGAIRDLTDIDDLLHSLRMRHPEKKVLAFAAGTFDKVNLHAREQQSDKYWFLDNRLVKQAYAEKAFADETSYRDWLYAQARGRVVVQTELFSASDGDLFAWQERLVDFKLDVQHELLGEKRAGDKQAPKTDYSGTLHRTGGPAIMVVSQCPAMDDIGRDEGFDMLRVPYLGAGKLDFTAAADAIAGLLDDPQARRKMVKKNIRTASRLGMPEIVFAYTRLAEAIAQAGTRTPPTRGRMLGNKGPRWFVLLAVWLYPTTAWAGSGRMDFETFVSGLALIGVFSLLIVTIYMVPKLVRSAFAAIGRVFSRLIHPRAVATGKPWRPSLGDLETNLKAQSGAAMSWETLLQTLPGPAMVEEGDLARNLDNIVEALKTNQLRKIGNPAVATKLMVLIRQKMAGLWTPSWEELAEIYHVHEDGGMELPNYTSYEISVNEEHYKELLDAMLSVQKFLDYRLYPLTEMRGTLQELQWLYGQKAAHQAVAAQAGLPVPGGFVVPGYVGLSLENQQAILEQAAALPGNKRWVVRSSPVHSMPGLLMTVDNLSTPEQLIKAIQDVRLSWEQPAARAYRAQHQIPEAEGLSVLIETMVAGDKNPRSASGVLFTRNPLTGQDEVSGRFLVQARGEEVVGRQNRELLPIRELENLFPDAYRQLLEAKVWLEKQYGEAAEIEFVIEDGKAWIVQDRQAALSPRARAQAALDMAQAGLVDRSKLAAILASALKKTMYRVNPQAGLSRIGVGIPSSPGAVKGVLVFGLEQAEAVARQGKKAVLAAWAQPEEVQAALVSGAVAGVMTRFGHESLHDSVLARALGVPLVDHVAEAQLADATTLRIGNQTLRRGDEIVLDGNEGILYAASGVPELMEDGRITVAGVQMDFDAETRKLQEAYQAKTEFQPLIEEHAQLVEKLLTSELDPQDLVRLNLAAHAAHLRIAEIGWSHGAKPEDTSRAIWQAYSARVKEILTLKKGPKLPGAVNSLWNLLTGQKLAGWLWALFAEAPLLSLAAAGLYASAWGKAVVVSLGALSLPAAPLLVLGLLAAFAAVHVLLEWRLARRAGGAYGWTAGWKRFGLRWMVLSPYALVASLANPWLAVAVAVHAVYDFLQIWPEKQPALVSVFRKVLDFPAEKFGRRPGSSAAAGVLQAAPATGERLTPRQTRPGWLNLFRQMDDRFNRPLKPQHRIPGFLAWTLGLGLSGPAFSLSAAWQQTIGYLRYQASPGLWRVLGTLGLGLILENRVLRTEREGYFLASAASYTSALGDELRDPRSRLREILAQDLTVAEFQQAMARELVRFLESHPGDEAAAGEVLHALERLSPSASRAVGALRGRSLRVPDWVTGQPWLLGGLATGLRQLSGVWSWNQFGEDLLKPRGVRLQDQAS
jgi:phosphoglycolate phosphatase-like HAD superfamily hydrolase